MTQAPARPRTYPTVKRIFLVSTALLIAGSMTPAVTATAAPGDTAGTAPSLPDAAHTGVGHPEDGALRLAALTQEVTRASGPEVFTALRALWLGWDKLDPTQVETALAQFETNPALAPSAQAYAGMLHAYARRRRGDLEGSTARIAALGYVSRFAVIGPFDNEGKGGFVRAFGPELDGAKAWDPEATYQGKERAVKWRIPPDVFHSGWLDFGSLVRPQENVCAYAVTFVRGEPVAGKADGPRDITLFGGASGAIKVFWNGDEVLTDEKYRLLDAERLGTRVRLEKGANRLLVKVCGTDNSPLFSLRIGDAQGRPNAHVLVSPDLPAGSADAAEHKNGADPKSGDSARSLPKKHFTALGALAGFEARIAGGRPHDLESLATYLTLTQGDDSSDMRARDLARRAAEKEPTVSRLLLAGALAEDRNQRAEWLRKAEAVPKKTRKERIDTLLALANHARAGVRWQDSIPYYDEVLALDPDETSATIARAELYAEAGLKETSITFLQNALSRKPTCVALLRTLAGELREAGRERDAAELQERYASLRFDDPSFVRNQLDLALAKRSHSDVDHWSKRLLALGEDSSVSLATAARAHLAMGERVIGGELYKKALALSPEDTDTMRALADVYALGAQPNESRKLLRKVLELKPQDKDVREYLAHLEPEKAKADEKYAVSSQEFLAGRDAPAGSDNRRSLVDLQVTTVFDNGLASRFHQVVFQPLTDTGAAQAREYAFSYEADSEVVQLRGARVYRKDGTVEEAAETGEAPADNPDVAMYTSGRVFYVHFPRLFPGDVVELQYRIEDVAERNAFADYFGEVRYFGGQEKVARADYVLITPKSRTLYFNPLPASIHKTVEETATSRVYKFSSRNLGSWDAEPGQPPFSEFLPHVHASTYKSWNEMGTWYWGLVRDQFVADDEVRKRVAEITKGLTDPAAKVRAVYNYVVQKTRYVALEFGIHGFKPYRCSQIFARGFGDCKDKATLIVTMLKELGIPATIVILRTGMRGDFESEPASLAPFDHAIAYVPSMDLYLDGTAENTGSSELPSMDRGALGLRVNEGKPELVHLPDPPASESVQEARIDAQIAADGSAQVSYTDKGSGLFASARRARYQAPASRKARFTEDHSGALPGFEIQTLDSNDLTSLDVAPEVRASGKVAALASVSGNTFTLTAGPRDHFVRDYAALSKRRRDIRLPGKTTQISDVTLHLPAGVTVKRVPEAVSGKSAFGSFAVQVEQKGLLVHVRTEVHVEKTRILAAEYEAFRAHCEAVDRALGQVVSYTR